MVILIHFLYLLTYHRAARLTLYNQLLFGYHTTYLDGQTARQPPTTTTYLESRVQRKISCDGLEAEVQRSEK